MPNGLDGKESASNAGDPGLIPWSGRSLGEGNGYLLEYYCLVNFMNRGVWRATKSWTKKSEHQRMDALQLWCWRRILRVPSTARRSNQSILKEINPEYSLEGLMLKLKLQYFGHLM